MKASIITLFLFFISLVVSTAQISTRTIKWKVSGVQDVVAGRPTDHFKELISTPTKVDFISKNGVLAASIAVVGSNGSWDNIDQDGGATLKVESGAQKGQLIFKRTGGKFFITMIILEGASRSIFDLSCSGYEFVTP